MVCMAAHYGLERRGGRSLPQSQPSGKFSARRTSWEWPRSMPWAATASESSPVERGAWVLRHLMHSPPPPAPANVPQLSRLDGKPLTKRQKLAAHMEEAQCASCHRKIDPIGFGLENFDAAGKWRSGEHRYTKNRKGKMVPSKKATPIDTSGAFHNGPAFGNFLELRKLTAKWQAEEFSRGFTEALIEYGLGRPFAITDEDLAQEILTKTKSKDYQMRDFIHALVQSKQFRTK